MKKLLLGTTALLGAGLMTAEGASAQEVVPGGALDITLSGFARFYGFIGDLAEKTGTNSGSYDFRTDTEIFFQIRNVDESTGIRYGAILEMEADTNASDQMDEVYLFMQGGFGEFRFGDEDSPADNMKIGGMTVAAFSGGIDGVGPLDMGAVVDGFDSGDSTKAIYYTPVVAGFQAGVSFTPDTRSTGTNIRSTSDPTSTSVQDLIEGGLAFTGDVAGLGIKASITGGYGAINDSSDDFKRIYGGLTFDIFGISVGGGYGYNDNAAPNDGAGVSISPGNEYHWYNVGAAATLGPAKVSINYGDAYDSDTTEPSEVVVGAEIGLMPGMVFGGEVAWFDRDAGGDDDGVLGLVGLRLAF